MEISLVLTSRPEGVSADLSTLKQKFAIMTLKPLSDEQQKQIILNQVKSEGNQFFEKLMKFAESGLICFTFWWILFFIAVCKNLCQRCCSFISALKELLQVFRSGLPPNKTDWTRDSDTKPGLQTSRQFLMQWSGVQLLLQGDPCHPWQDLLQRSFWQSERSAIYGKATSCGESFQEAFLHRLSTVSFCIIAVLGGFGWSLAVNRMWIHMAKETRTARRSWSLWSDDGATYLGREGNWSHKHRHPLSCVGLVLGNCRSLSTWRKKRKDSTYEMIIFSHNLCQLQILVGNSFMSGFLKALFSIEMESRNYQYAWFQWKFLRPSLLLFEVGWLILKQVCYGHVWQTEGPKLLLFDSESTAGAEPTSEYLKGANTYFTDGLLSASFGIARGRCVKHMAGKCSYLSGMKVKVLSRVRSKCFGMCVSHWLNVYCMPTFY